LLSLRAQDRKSNARVQAMLKRTKAANKAVLDDVKNSLQTSITAAGKFATFIMYNFYLQHLQICIKIRT
jgi:hypothetical protein